MRGGDAEMKKQITEYGKSHGMKLGGLIVERLPHCARNAGSRGVAGGGERPRPVRHRRVGQRTVDVGVIVKAEGAIYHAGGSKRQLPSGLRDAARAGDIQSSQCEQPRPETQRQATRLPAPGTSRRFHRA